MRAPCSSHAGTKCRFVSSLVRRIQSSDNPDVVHLVIRILSDNWSLLQQQRQRNIWQRWGNGSMVLRFTSTNLETLQYLSFFFFFFSSSNLPNALAEIILVGYLQTAPRVMTSRYFCCCSTKPVTSSGCTIASSQPMFLGFLPRGSVLCAMCLCCILAFFCGATSGLGSRKCSQVLHADWMQLFRLLSFGNQLKN